MKKILIFLAVFCISLCAHAANVTGLWETINDETGKPKSIIRVFERDGLVYARVEVIYKPDGTTNIVRDGHGKAVCDESFRAESMPGAPSFCGLLIIKGLRPNNRGVYSGGTVTNPLNNRTYRVEMWVANDDNLIVRGRWGIFSRKQIALPFSEEELAALFN